MIKVYLYKTRVALSVLCVTVFFVIVLGLYERQLHHKVDDFQHHLSSLNRQAVRSQEAAAFIKAHEREFTAFELCEFERVVTPEALQSSHAYTIDFGSASPVNLDSKNSGLIVQEVSFTIPCLQDRDVFALLDQLTNKGPGLFHISEVTIKRMSSLSDEMLRKLLLENPRPYLKEGFGLHGFIDEGAHFLFNGLRC